MAKIPPFDAQTTSYVSKKHRHQDYPRKIKRRKESFILSKSQYTPSKLWVDLSVNYVCKSLYPSCCMLLLELSLLVPLSVACAERLFSKMKLIKTRLRNKLLQVSLDPLIRISTEAPYEFSDTEYEFSVDELKRLNPKMIN